jgi:cell filamentation protein
LSGYDVFDDPYCYKSTSVLKNRARIRDAQTLGDFELEMSTLRSLEPLPDGRFTPAHYKRVHHHLFQDVYSWAGKYRTVRTAKGGNWFCYPEHITSSTNQLFKKLALPVFKQGVNFLSRHRHRLHILNCQRLVNLAVPPTQREPVGRRRV